MFLHRRQEDFQLGKIHTCHGKNLKYERFHATKLFDENILQRVPSVETLLDHILGMDCSSLSFPKLVVYSILEMNMTLI